MAYQTTIRTALVLGTIVTSSLALLVSCRNSIPFNTDGLVNFAGRQADIVGENNIDGLVQIASMSGQYGAYGLGAYQGLDGEITVFEGQPYVTQIRNGDIILTHQTDGSAIFAAWTTNTEWQDEPVPARVNSYVELQYFIKERAEASGIDTAATAFPFLITGSPKELQWHINTDRTDGRAVTRESFQASKDSFVLRDEAVNIVGFYSESHHGVFIGNYAPAMGDSVELNAMHMHLVSQDGALAGHIDDLTFTDGMVLRLPQK
ncbi:MAG: acetolactate decarboxylase [Pseudohongiella sp.]|nr:acetolactate decarboxylase [Pseudohongiella sp.]